MIQPPVRDPELGLLPIIHIWFGDEMLWADCGNCGQRIGLVGDPSTSLESYSAAWERHSMTLCPERQK